MCFQPTAVRPWHKWRWSGDLIIPSVVPAARTVPGGGPFAIDIREYLSIEGDAVVRRFVQDRLKGASDAETRRFATSEKGHFDHRARRVREWVGELEHQSKGRAARDWLFPAETIENEGGDCEDLAFLIAALLEAVGISSACIRVALGYLVEHAPGREEERHDHAWVMYLDEGGVWQIFEPLALLPKKATRAHRKAVGGTQVEYVPWAVFNRQHLWRVRTPHGENRPSKRRKPSSRASKQRADESAFVDFLEARTFWKRFNPTFATGVHNGIYEHALGMHLDAHQLQLVRDASFWTDANVMTYDPRDHFDFAYIDAGWDRVEERLREPDLTEFARAAHAICDFYSHTLWAHPSVNAPQGGRLPLYDRATADFAALTWNFSQWGDRPGCDHTLQHAEDTWQGQLISGQWWRWFTTYPDELERPAELTPRFCLPDHDALSVDSDHAHDTHRLFTNPAEYTRQFELRRDAAARHVEQAFVEWYDLHGDAALP
ncbi:MAG: transglutaminase-like domain-containing protein [Myxococcaceae bacterium]